MFQISATKWKIESTNADISERKEPIYLPPMNLITDAMIEKTLHNRYSSTTAAINQARISYPVGTGPISSKSA